MTPTKFGRYQVAEPPSKLASLHFHDEGTVLKEVDFSPKCSILDQEDLHAQGIDVSTFIPGGSSTTDAIGSCTAQTFVEWASQALTIDQFIVLVKTLTGVQLTANTIYTDTKTLEMAAIVFYYRCTNQTGDPAQEWPPTDCGSTGLYVFDEGKALSIVASEKVASGALNMASLMQTGPLLGGIPFLNAWMNPLASDNYCIDGDGSTKTLREQIAEGVAGGHELLFPKIVQLAVPNGVLDPFNTIIEFPNHWSSNWADQGRARVHLSTLAAFGSQADFRQFSAVA